MTRPGGPTPENTPGVVGYLVAVAVSLGWYTVLLAVPDLAYGGPLLFLETAAWILYFVCLYGLPIGLFGAFVVHVVCAPYPEQVVHVMMAAVVGLLVGVLFWGGYADGEMLGAPALLVGVAAGLGRASVIPRVNRRRAAVEDDFRPVP